jgi:hypothetical protein
VLNRTSWSVDAGHAEYVGKKVIKKKVIRKKEERGDHFGTNLHTRSACKEDKEVGYEHFRGR